MLCLTEVEAMFSGSLDILFWEQSVTLALSLVSVVFGCCFCVLPGHPHCASQPGESEQEGGFHLQSEILTENPQLVAVVWDKGRITNATCREAVTLPVFPSVETPQQPETKNQSHCFHCPFY